LTEPIFVFGSNLAGRHGKGAALWALKHRGAIVGQGKGLQGQSYGIPTKDENIRTLPIIEIRGYVNEFLEFARSRKDLQFELTPIGCGLAGYRHNQIAPLFASAPSNVIIPPEFAGFLGNR